MIHGNIEDRIKHIEDQNELKRLMNTYHWRADHDEWESWSELFTEDATYNFRNSWGFLNGRAEIRDVCREKMRDAWGATQHLLVNLEFTITGENSAIGHGNLFFAGCPDAAKPDENYITGGRYNWEFKRTPAGWRIYRGQLDFLWNTGNLDFLWVPDANSATR